MLQEIETKAISSKLILDACPGCREPKIFAGYYFDITFPIRNFKVKLFWFWTPLLNFNIRLQYCPKCGFLKFSEGDIV